MINIDVVLDHYLWKKKIKNPKIYIKKKLEKLNKLSLFKKKSNNYTIFLTNNKKMKALNKKFRNKKNPTDVLSFPLSNKILISKKTYIGDIVISYNFMDKPKSQDNKNFKEKIIKTFIHGYLHLLGFNHVKDRDYKKMLREEEKIYKSVISKIE